MSGIQAIAFFVGDVQSLREIIIFLDKGAVGAVNCFYEQWKEGFVSFWFSKSYDLIVFCWNVFNLFACITRLMHLV